MEQVCFAVAMSFEVSAMQLAAMQQALVTIGKSDEVHERLDYHAAIVPDVIDGAWRGVFRVGAELIGTPIQVHEYESLGPSAGRFGVSW